MATDKKPLADNREPFYKQPLVWLAGIIAALFLWPPEDGEAGPKPPEVEFVPPRTYTVE